MSKSNIFVYLAAPYTQSDSSANVRRVVEIATSLRNSYPTVQVFVPHLYHFWNLMVPEPRVFWLDQCFGWIEKCDLLCRLEGESEGADKEVEKAQQQGKLVLFGARDLFDYLDSHQAKFPFPCATLSITTKNKTLQGEFNNGSETIHFELARDGDRVTESVRAVRKLYHRINRTDLYEETEDGISFDPHPEPIELTPEETERFAKIVAYALATQQQYQKYQHRLVFND